MGLNAPSIPEESTDVALQEDSNIAHNCADRIQVYNSISCPDRPERRYHVLNQAATEVALN